MSVYLIEGTMLEAIADAIREKTGGTESILTEDMSNEIRSIETGGSTGGVNKLAQIVARTITKVTAEELAGVTNIGNYAFGYCSMLEEITIPETVTTLGDSAFSRTALKNVTLPPKITSIGSGLFFQCVNLKCANIPGGVSNIPVTVFSGCTALEFVDFSQHTSVPTLTNSTTFNKVPSTCKISVPDALYNEWINATNWAALKVTYVKASGGGGGAEGNWLFQDKMINGMAITGLPAPVIGTSYTCFVDGEEIATARCEENWDGTPLISFSTEDYRVCILYDLTAGDTDWYFHPAESQVQSGSVSIRININGGGTND